MGGGGVAAAEFKILLFIQTCTQLGDPECTTQPAEAAGLFETRSRHSAGIESRAEAFGHRGTGVLGWRHQGHTSRIFRIKSKRLKTVKAAQETKACDFLFSP